MASIRKADLQQVLAAVGQTTCPTTVVMRQPAHELHRYHGEPVVCSLEVWGDGERKAVQVRRFRIQLANGGGQHVCMNCPGLQLTTEVRSVVPCRRPLRPRGRVGHKLLADMLTTAVGEHAFDRITVREDGSATALVNRGCLDEVLRRNGHE